MRQLCDKCGLSPKWRYKPLENICFNCYCESRIKPFHSYQERNLAIFNCRLDGLTYKQIGKKFKLTVARIRQIVIHADCRDMLGLDVSMDVEEVKLSSASIWKQYEWKKIRQKMLKRRSHE